MKPSSFDRYVDAHEWEWKVEAFVAIIVGIIIAIWWLAAQITEIRAERKRRRENGLL